MHEFICFKIYALQNTFPFNNTRKTSSSVCLRTGNRDMVHYYSKVIISFYTTEFLKRDFEYCGSVTSMRMRKRMSENA